MSQQTATQRQRENHGTQELDPSSLAAIRLAMADSSPAKSRKVRVKLPGKARLSEPAGPVAVSNQNTAVPHAAQDGMATESALAPSIKQPATLRDRTVATVLGILSRIRTKHVAIVTLALLCWFRPWLMFGLAMLCVIAFFGVFMLMGHHDYWARVVTFGRWYAARWPEKAARHHAKLTAFALRWDAFLDRFPEGWVDGLYIPDLGELAEAEARHDAALDRRLTKLREREG